MENQIEKNLAGLLKLQSIDNKINELSKMRGALPTEISDLEDDIIGLETREKKFQNELKEIEEGINGHKEGIKNAEKLIKKYNEQQETVRNNREFDAISKELELQSLEIQILEKKIKEDHEKIELNKQEIENVKAKKEEMKISLTEKKEELENLDKESAEDEAKLLKSRQLATKGVEERLLVSYEKILLNMRNKLAVVQVKRDACGGCFNIVPPQKQGEIREKKKIIICEHCGRILAEVAEEIVEDEKPKKRKSKKAEK